MNWNKRPLAITILACVYLGVGTVGFAAHSADLLSRQPDAVWVELTELIAILCGAFLLLGHNWARWLALAWIGFHVILSAFHSFREFGIHVIFCALIAWLVLKADAARYFHRTRVKPI